tara:strand:+ start:2981 stop:3253 length:273 start_codon:yes stop_codon:yes gene_type:complete
MKSQEIQIAELKAQNAILEQQRLEAILETKELQIQTLQSEIQQPAHTVEEMPLSFGIGLVLFTLVFCGIAITSVKAKNEEFEKLGMVDIV